MWQPRELEGRSSAQPQHRHNGFQPCRQRKCSVISHRVITCNSFVSPSSFASDTVYFKVLFVGCDIIFWFPVRLRPRIKMAGVWCHWTAVRVQLIRESGLQLGTTNSWNVEYGMLPFSFSSFPFCSLFFVSTKICAPDGFISKMNCWNGKKWCTHTCILVPQPDSFA